jgi:Trk K+ transport system NAD-binding subunit
MHNEAAELRRPPSPVLLIGRGDLAVAVASTLESCAVEVRRLRSPSDRDLRSALRESVRAVVLVSRDDIEALRLALLIEYLQPGMRLIVTIFGRTVAAQIERVIPSCEVISMADAAAPSLAAACLGDGLLFVDGTLDDPIAVRERAAQPLAAERLPRRRPRVAFRATGWLVSQLRPLDPGSRLLVIGIVGLLAALLLEISMGVIADRRQAVDAFYDAVKTVTTIGPNAVTDRGSESLKLMGSIVILATAVFYVVFTAGLVNRLLAPRLTGIIGTRTIPRSGHVVVIGLGQVGLRLSVALRALGIPVVAVERRRDAPNVRVAVERKIPVVIGHGGSRFLLSRLSLRRARALAAVTSDDGANVAISVAALAACAETNVVMRAGDGEVTAETQALFPIGVTRDVLRLGAARLAAAAVGLPVRGVFTSGEEVFAIDLDNGCRRFAEALRAAAGAKTTTQSGHDSPLAKVASSGR